MEQKKYEIKLTQKPVIEHQITEVGDQVKERIAALNIDKMVATEDTLKSLKETRATLNKEFAAYEKQRKYLKNALMLPYNEIDPLYKQNITEIYQPNIKLCSSKIDKVETELKDKKKEKAKEYFVEKCLANEEIDFITFDGLNLNIKLSASDKSYRDEIDKVFTQTNDDLELIKTQQYEVEILAEYKQSRNVSNAIKTVNTRKENEKKEAQKLIDKRTDRRVKNLISLGFFYSDNAKSYLHVKNNNISISYSEVCSLEDHEFNVSLHAKSLLITPQPEAPLKSPTTGFSGGQTKPILKASTTTAKAEMVTAENGKVETTVIDNDSEVFEASFTVKGTKKELTALSEFLKANCYNYKNI